MILKATERKPRPLRRRQRKSFALFFSAFFARRGLTAYAVRASYGTEANIRQTPRSVWGVANDTSEARFLFTLLMQSKTCFALGFPLSLTSNLTSLTLQLHALTKGECSDTGFLSQPKPFTLTSHCLWGQVAVPPMEILFIGHINAPPKKAERERNATRV